MSEIVVYIRERDVDAYIAQGWRAWRMTHHHGARYGVQMKTFMAVIQI